MPLLRSEVEVTNCREEPIELEPGESVEVSIRLAGGVLELDPWGEES